MKSERFFVIQRRTYATKMKLEGDRGQFLKGMKYFLMKLAPFALLSLLHTVSRGLTPKKYSLISYRMNILNHRLKETNECAADITAGCKTFSS